MAQRKAEQSGELPSNEYGILPIDSKKLVECLGTTPGELHEKLLKEQKEMIENVLIGMTGSGMWSEQGGGINA